MLTCDSARSSPRCTLPSTERAAGGTGLETTHRRLLFFQSFQTALVRSTTTMAVRLSASMPAGGTDPDDPSTFAPLPPSLALSLCLPAP